MTDTVTERPRDRAPTGVPGLDTILHGGLLRRGVYLLQGNPGAGKTILANQLCFHHTAEGGRAIYATLLAETHERMLFNLEQLTFFEASRIPEQLTYLSVFSALEAEGLKGVMELLRREARSRKATLLVVDGFVAAEEPSSLKQDFKKFIHDLQVHANLLGCTVLLIASGVSDALGPEHTMVDGVLEVSDNRVGRHAERELEVKKFRGSGYIRGGHAFQITREGVKVYPRLEALLQDPSPEDPCTAERVSTGLSSLDSVLQGGLACATSTVIFGPTGVGKTTLGLHFLNESSEAEPGLHFGFYETPPRLLHKARALGLDWESKLKQGVLDIQWYPPTERVLDVLGHKLLAAVRERGVKRLFVDGVDGFIKAADNPTRITHFFSALTNELRIRGVTAMYTSELFDLFSTQVGLPLQGISGLVENVFLLRFLEADAQTYRMFSVV
jgi:circadian clock protein KaiC